MKVESSSGNQDRKEEFVVLFVRHEAAIHSFVLTLLPDFASSEDVMQEAGLTMWRRFDQYRSDTNFRNWAFQIAKNTTMNYISKAKRDRHLFGERLIDVLSQQAERRTDELDSRRQALSYCIDKLSDENRSVVTGCYEQRSTIKAYADSLGYKPNKIYKQLNHVRALLMKCIERQLREASLE